MKLNAEISPAIKGIMILIFTLVYLNTTYAQRPGYGISNWTQASDRDWNKKYWESRARSNSSNISIGSTSNSYTGSTLKPIIFESRRARKQREEKQAKERMAKEMQMIFGSYEYSASNETKIREQENLRRIMERTRNIDNLEYYLEKIPRKIMDKGREIGEVVQYKSKSGLIKDGRSIQPFIFDMIDDISAGMILVKKDGKFGYLDSAGTLVIPVVYDDAKLFQSNGLARVSKNGKWGFVNSRNEESVLVIYDTVSLFSQYLIFGNKVTLVAKMKFNNKWGFVDEKGFEGIPPLWDSVGNHDYEGKAIVKNDGKYGIINLRGFELTPIKWDSIGQFSKGKKRLAMVKYGNKYGLIDLIGNEVIPPRWDRIYAFDSLGYAPVKSGARVGFITEEGIEIIPARYDYITTFGKYGLSRVRLNNKWGMLNRKGEEIIAVKYDSMGNWKNDRIIVKLNGKSGILDYRGKAILNVTHDYIGPFINGYATVRKDRKYGIIDDKFNVVLPTDYENIFHGLYYVHAIKSGKHRVISQEKKLLIPDEFQEVKMQYFDKELSVMKKGEWLILADDKIKTP